MSSSAVKTPQALAKTVWFDKDMMHVVLMDGREISVPLEWFPRLRAAKESQRKKWRLIGNGVGLHWADIDEDISITALLEK